MAETEVGPGGRRVATVRRPGEPFLALALHILRGCGRSDANPGHDDSSTILSGDSKLIDAEDRIARRRQGRRRCRCSLGPHGLQRSEP